MKTIALTERRPVVRRLRRADAEELARHFRHAVDLVPTLDRGAYRLTARGHVGFFRTANVRWEVRPKLPWDGLRWLTAPRSAPDSAGHGPGTDWPAGLASLLAGRLADLIRERSTAGLHHDYAERRAESATVRGRIDFARHARDPVGPPDRFHVVADEFTPDVVWNLAPKAAARRLLAVPGLAPEARAALLAALDDLAAVADDQPAAAELDRLVFDARTEGYRALIRLSRIVLGEGGSAADHGETMLVNLEHLFQLHVTELLTRPGRLPMNWGVEPQAEVTPTQLRGTTPCPTLRADLLVRGPAGAPASVWDVKWKRLGPSGPSPADVHQVLGYAAAFGVQSAGLVYPGRRFAAGTFELPGTPLRLRVVRLRLVGPPAARERSADRFARLVKGR